MSEKKFFPIDSFIIKFDPSIFAGVFIIYAKLATRNENNSR